MLLQMKIVVISQEPHYPVAAAIAALEDLIEQMKSITPQQQERLGKTGKMSFPNSFQVKNEFAAAGVDIEGFTSREHMFSPKDE